MPPDRPSPAQPLSREAIDAAVRERLAPDQAGTALRIVETIERITAGNEELVRLVLDEGPAPWEPGHQAISSLTRPLSRVARWVDETLLPGLPEQAAVLLRLGRDLWPLGRDLIAALPAPDPPYDLMSAYDHLAHTGLITTNTAGEPLIVPLIAACLGRAPAPPRAEAWWQNASQWYADQGLPGPALRAARYAEDTDRTQELIEAHGDAIIASGWPDDLVAAVDELPPAQTSLRLRILQGHAARISGQPQLADRILSTVSIDTSSWGEAAPDDLAWRLASVAYGRADFKGAIEACTAGRTTNEPSEDRAMRLATLAMAQWMLGDSDSAARAAAEALAAARTAPDGVLAHTQLAQSLLLSGARRHNALAAALGSAERSGNLFLIQRTLVNLADAHLVAGDYAAARDAALRAIDLVERTGPAGCFASALHNLGEALVGLGDLDGARLQFLRCLDIARSNGLDRTPAALWGLAEIDYSLGHLGDARAAYLEAIDLARETGERQVLVPALARLATVVATEPADNADLVLAQRLAEESAAEASEEIQAEAITALGWVALARTALDEAAALGIRASEAARSHGNRRALGPALELLAAAESDPDLSGGYLQEALAVYQRCGAVLACDRVSLSLSRIPGEAGLRGAAARAAVRRLRRAGVAPRVLHPTGVAATGSLQISVLGGFDVARDGVPIPASAWRSRQARTLLKLLAARHGRPIGREELCETLWPGDDPAKTGHRLSVLLSTLRGALDPGKHHCTEHFIAADSQGVRLMISSATLDLTDFLDDAAEAARLTDEGEEGAARQLLTDLLAGYRGEAFEEDPYEAWAEDVRHHVRAAWVQSLRLAARLAGRAGDIDVAVTCLVRILAADPYDDPAHRMLVAVLVRARRHGEARRAFDRWVRAMNDVGAEPPGDEVLSPVVISR
jgi:DNA-binding SARP family transcriptional activator